MASITTRQTGTTGVDGVTRKDSPLTNAEIDQNFININNELVVKAPTSNPTFTGTVSGITASMVGLGNVTNESKATMFSSPTFTGTVSGITKAMVGLGNVTNESKATMFSSPTFTGTITIPAGTQFYSGGATFNDNESRRVVDYDSEGLTIYRGGLELDDSAGAGAGRITWRDSSGQLAYIEEIGDASINTAGLKFVVGGGVGFNVLTINQNEGIVATNSSARFNSLGVGTSASGLAGEIRATNDITAFYSDKRLKQDIQTIENALDKIDILSGVYYTQNKLAEEYGYNNYNRQVGVLAQEVQLVLPEAVKPAPFDIAEDGSSKSGENYLTVQYEKLIPLLIQAIKELKVEIETLKQR